jgi:hypothetical protein
MEFIAKIDELTQEMSDKFTIHLHGFKTYREEQLYRFLGCNEGH